MKKIPALLFVCYCSLAMGQEPKLESVFNDDFSNDTRSDYAAKGDVEWVVGKLTLSEGASLERAINGGPWAKVTLRLQSAEMNADRRQTELRVGFMLDGATPCYVRLQETFEGGKTDTSIALIDVGEKDGKPSERLVREAVMRQAKQRGISVEYRQGLVRVVFSKTIEFRAYIENGGARIRAVTFQAKESDHRLELLAARAYRQKQRDYTAAEKKQIAKADAKNGELISFYRQGNFAEAAKIGEQVLKIHKSVLGEHHPKYAISLNNLAVMYDNLGDFVRAEPLYKRAVGIEKSVFGGGHPSYANKLNNLAVMYDKTGDYVRAVPLYTTALEINKSVLGEGHPRYASSLSNLAGVYQRMGNYARAEPLYMQALNIQKSVTGTQHADYALSLNNLALLYRSIGDNTRAEPLYKQTIEIAKSDWGQQHPQYATLLNNLAMGYLDLGDYAKAEPLFKKARDIRKSVFGEEHPAYGNSLTNLALLYDNMGDYDRAEPFYQQALGILKSGLGEEHPEYTASLNNLATLYQNMGDYGRAEPVYKQALGILKTGHGEEHPHYAAGLSNLAMLYRSMSDNDRAEPLLGHSVRLSLDLLENTAVVLSERQQLAMGQSLRSRLDDYVSLALPNDRYHTAAARYCLQWKGATMVRQRALRLAAKEPSIATRFRELQQVARNLAALSRAKPGKAVDNWKTKITNLTHMKERLESELSKDSATFRSAMQSITVEQIQQAIPSGGLVVDFLQYRRSQPTDEKGKMDYSVCMLAIAVHASGEPKLIDLGPVAPLSEAIDTWRETFGMSPQGRKAGNDIRKQIWEPLLKHIAGAETVLVSTDGVLGRMPLAALPGKQAGTYLIEDHRLAMIPVPQLLPAIVNDLGRKALSGELLLMGDVNYDKSSRRKNGKRKKRKAGENRTEMMDAAFGPLPGTAGEVKDLRELHNTVFKPDENAVGILEQARATEARFREVAGRYRHLHLATHGFFAAARHKSALANDTERSGAGLGQLTSSDTVTGWNPGLLSGLAFAGANLEPEPGEDDGILTAQEIAFLPLNGVDTVVLSACETGLGEVAGGEGLIGIQRAFQIAGVRSTVASYWKVDDAVTRRLMEKFYRNIWEKKMPRLDALRAAQLEVMTDATHPSIPRGTVSKLKQPTGNTQTPKRTSPKFWAAFQLSGDWR